MVAACCENTFLQGSRRFGRRLLQGKVSFKAFWSQAAARKGQFQVTSRLHHTHNVQIHLQLHVLCGELLSSDGHVPKQSHSVTHAGTTPV
jgi:hypothetical protein